MKNKLFVPEISYIIDNLYLGSRIGTFPFYLQPHGITHVVNITNDIPPPDPNYVPLSRVLIIPIDDVPNANIKKHFDRINIFIDNAIKQGGTVLVHCRMGVSRSASAVIAYLMYKEGMTFNNAFRYVLMKRPIINPNPGFEQQLIEFQNELSKRHQPFKHF